MSLKQIQALVRNGLYYLTEHAYDEAADDGFDIYVDERDPHEFLEGETCEYCGGKLVEKRVTLHRKLKNKYITMKDVPAGVCVECGTRYYAANVLKTIEASIRGRRKAQRQVLVPVYSV